MTAPDELPPRYRDVAPLGRGAFGAVYRAVDALGRPAAVKVLDAAMAADAQAAWLFAGELRRLARLAHPAFPAALDEGHTPDGRPYYAMALAEGESPKGPLDASAVRAVLASLADALAYLHGVGLVHGDLKPENMRVSAAGRVTILDVGLMAPVGAIADEVAGTLAYMAPEVLRRAPVSEGRDLYALGATAFELWSGRPPFAGPPADVVRAHLAGPIPASPRAEQDPALDGLLRALLAKDPADRPSARAVAAAIRGEPAPPSGRALRLGELVGREAALATFDAALASGGWLAFEAPEGGGKTRLLDELRVRTRQAGRSWVSVAAGGDAPAAPLRALVGRAVAMAGFAPGPHLAAWLAGQVPSEAAELEPAARRVFEGAAVAEALGRAATALGGLVVAIDDWQAIDGASRALVAHLARAPRTAPLLWVIAGEPNAEWPVPPEPLPPLGADAVAAYLASRLGSAPPAELLAELAGVGGSPLLLDLLLEGHAASGALACADGAWRFRPGASAPATPTAALAALVAPKVGSLDAPARRLAAWLALAVDAGELPAAVLLEAAEAAPGDLDALVASGLAVAPGSRVRLASPAYAPWLSVDAEVGARCAVLARALMGGRPAADVPSDALFPAARLALGGDDAGLSATLAAEAGRRALGAADPHEARRLLLAAAEATPPDAAPAVRLAIALPLAEAERLTDRLDDAAPRYASAIALARTLGDRRAAARAGIGLAKCRQLKGDYPAALAALAEATDAAVAADDGAQAARALATEARLLAYRGQPAEAVARCERAADLARASGAPALEAQALNLLGYLIVHEDLARGPEALTMLERAIALADAAGDRLGRGLALDNLGNARLALGDLAGARDAFDRYAENCRAIGADTEAIAARLNQAIVAAERGETDRALALGHQVVDGARAAGRKFLVGAALAAVGQALWRAGRLDEALAPFDEALALATAIQNRLLEEHVRAFRLEAQLALGDLAAAHVEVEALGALNRASKNAEMADRLDAHLAELAHQRGDAPAARGHLDRLLESPNRLAAHRAHQIAARVAIALGTDARAHAEAALAIARAWDAPWHLQADLALSATAATAAGDTELGRALAREALDVGRDNPFARAEAALLVGGAATELAPAREAIARLAADRRAGARRAQHLEGLDAAPAPRARSVGTAVSPEGFALAIEALAAASDEAAIGRAALAGAMDLARAERGYMLAYEGGRLRQAVTHRLDYEAEAAEGFSRSIVEQALFTQTPLYVTDAGADAAWHDAASVMALQLKTVVCLPLATPDRILGVLYMDRQAIDPVLSDADMALLQAFATAAASAIARERARAEADLAADVATGLGAALARRLSPEAVHRELLAAAIATVGAERGFWLTARDGLWPAALGLDASGRDVADTDVSRGVVDAVAASGEAIGVLDLANAEGFQDRLSVQALGLRTVWCLPVAEGALLYLDTTAMPESDPAFALGGLEALVRHARPFLAS